MNPYTYINTKKAIQKWWKKRKKWQKRLITSLVYIALVLSSLTFAIWFAFGRHNIVPVEDMTWGVTYSPLASEGFDLNSDTVYSQVVKDLKPNKIRLAAYWNRIMPNSRTHDFSELDRQVDLASKHEIPITLVVGRRVPRYPECHEPNWVEELSVERQQAELLKFMKQVIQRYDDKQYLESWQIENEPFLGSFGDCPPLSEKFLEEEFALARSLTKKNLITTESGELSFWLKASKYPDVLGTTLYRRVLIQGTNIAVNHIYPSWYYRARSNIVKLIRPNIKNVIISELQGEPWVTTSIKDSSREELNRTMNPAQFESIIDFTENIGFPEIYWWGVEWWYYELLNGNDYYWNRAKQLFNQ